MGWREQVALLQETVVRVFSDAQDPELFNYTPSGLATVQLLGVYRDKHTYVDTRTTVQVSSEQPTLDVRAAALPRAPLRDDVVAAVATRFAGRTWRVVDAQGDGEGLWKLFLVQTSP